MKSVIFPWQRPAGVVVGPGGTSRPTHYQVLGVDPAAERFLIEAAYRAQIRRGHPDLGGDPAHARQINAAYAVLRDEHSRRKYDLQLAAERTASSEPAPQRRGASGEQGWSASASYLALGVLLAIWGLICAMTPMERAFAVAAAAIGGAIGP